jgi:hypothetical protein
MQDHHIKLPEGGIEKHTNILNLGPTPPGNPWCISEYH